VELHRRNSASFRLHVRVCAVVVVEGATISPLHGATTMLALGLLLNFAGIGLFCWLIFTLAVYALPFFVALNVFMMAIHSGAGVLGAPLVAIAAGGMMLAIEPNCLRHDALRDHPCHRCRPVCRPGGTCWLSVRICDVANRRAFIGLARDLRLSRRGLYWRHGVDAVDRLRRDPPAQFGQGSRERSSTGSHGRSASAMILRHLPVELVGYSSARNAGQRASAKGSRDLPWNTSMTWR
jgi:hypothetical protein